MNVWKAWGIYENQNSVRVWRMNQAAKTPYCQDPSHWKADVIVIIRQMGMAVYVG